MYQSRSLYNTGMTARDDDIAVRFANILQFVIECEESPRLLNEEELDELKTMIFDYADLKEDQGYLKEAQQELELEVDKIIDEGQKSVQSDSEGLTGSKSKKLRALFGFLFDKCQRANQDIKDQEEQTDHNDHKEQSKNNDKLAQMQRNIAEKDNELKELNQKLEERNNYMLNMDNEQTDMSNELDHLKRELDANFTELEAKTRELDDFKEFHTQNINKLEDELRIYQKDLKQNNRELEKYKNAKSSIQDELTTQMTSNQSYHKTQNMERQMTEEFSKMRETIEQERTKMREDLVNEMEKSIQKIVPKETYKKEHGNILDESVLNTSQMNGVSPNKSGSKKNGRKNRVEHYLEEFHDEEKGFDADQSMQMSQLDLSQIAAEGGGYNAIAKRMSDKYDQRIKAVNKEIANLRERNGELERLGKIAKRKLDQVDLDYVDFQQKIVEQTERQNNQINGQHEQIIKLKTKTGYLRLNCGKTADKHIKDFDLCYDEDHKATILYVEKRLKDKKSGKDRENNPLLKTYDQGLAKVKELFKKKEK